MQVLCPRATKDDDLYLVLQVQPVHSFQSFHVDFISPSLISTYIRNKLNLNVLFIYWIISFSVQEMPLPLFIVVNSNSSNLPPRNVFYWAQPLHMQRQQKSRLWRDSLGINTMPEISSPKTTYTHTGEEETFPNPPVPSDSVPGKNLVSLVASQPASHHGVQPMNMCLCAGKDCCVFCGGSTSSISRRSSD